MLKKQDKKYFNQLMGEVRNSLSVHESLISKLIHQQRVSKLMSAVEIILNPKVVSLSFSFGLGLFIILSGALFLYDSVVMDEKLLIVCIIGGVIITTMALFVKRSLYKRQ